MVFQFIKNAGYLFIIVPVTSYQFWITV